MEYRPLKITLVSAKEIKNMNTFSKQDVYAVVSLAGYPKSKQKTHVDKDCGTKPKWKRDMEFIVDEPFLTKPGLSLLVEIFAESTLRSDKLIGSVTLPIDDLFRSNSGHEKKTVKYQVITDGKPKGTLKLSYNFGEKFTHGGETHKSGHDQHVSTFAAEKTGEPMTAYPAPPGAHPGMGYPPQYAPPYQAAYGGYPAQPSGYGYMPPPQPGYGYQPPPQGGYPQGPPAGYAGYPAGPKQKPKKNKMGMGGGLGLGLGAGLLGGLLVGEAIDDIGDAASYADGYDDAMGDMGGGFDF